MRGAEELIGEVRVCIDANDVARVAGFWSDAFGYVEHDEEPAGGWRHLQPQQPGLPLLSIQPVPEVKDGKNRLHLDIWVDEPDPWIERCRAAGATAMWCHDEPDDWFLVMADPEGNEFCICRTR